METWKHGDMETLRLGDMETWRHGKMETWRQGPGLLMFYSKIKRKMKNEAQAIFLNLFTVCSSFNGRLSVVRLLRKKQTVGSYPSMVPSKYGLSWLVSFIHVHSVSNYFFKECCKISMEFSVILCCVKDSVPWQTTNLCTLAHSA